MRVVPTGIWRSLRWMLVLLCIGGGVLAAENNWLTSLRVGPVSLTNWLAQLSGDSRSEPSFISAELPKAPAVTYATNSWLDTALFSPPASGWTLDPAKAVTGPMFKNSQTSSLINPVFSSSSLPKAFFSSGFISYTPGIDFGPVPGAPNVSGIWTSNASGNWSNAANWSAGLIADGAGNNANFDALNITTDVTVTLDSSRTIGQLFVGDLDGTHHYTIGASGGSTLTFDSNVAFTAAVLQQSSTSAGDTISVPIVL